MRVEALVAKLEADAPRALARWLAENRARVVDACSHMRYRMRVGGNVARKITTTMRNALKAIHADTLARESRSTWEKTHGIPMVPSFASVSPEWADRYGSAATFRALVVRGLIMIEAKTTHGSEFNTYRGGFGRWSGSRATTNTTYWVRLTEAGLAAIAED
jgi:hypothetical protein